MDVADFVFTIWAALLMGVAIGLERQARQNTAGLRTNALVCVGAALFVSLSVLMDDQNSPTRMASYVVSGVGFLGGGIILRDGLNVKGIDTAATLWCSAAVGTLVGSGFVLHGLAATLTVLALNLVLRPVAQRIDTLFRTAPDMEETRCTCRSLTRGRKRVEA
jgi:putative Mg2+ transporter-C (MgtC) family protein